MFKTSFVRLDIRRLKLVKIWISQNRFFDLISHWRGIYYGQIQTWSLYFQRFMAYKLVLAGVELWSNIPCIRFVLEFNFTSRITKTIKNVDFEKLKITVFIKIGEFLAKCGQNSVSWCIWVMFGQKIAFPKQDDQWPKIQLSSAQKIFLLLHPILVFFTRFHQIPPLCENSSYLRYLKYFTYPKFLTFAPLHGCLIFTCSLVHLSSLYGHANASVSPISRINLWLIINYQLSIII